MCCGCGETLICIGDIWYGPHTDSNCSAGKAHVISKVSVSNEPMLPDFIEVKQEEIVDIDGDEIDENAYNEEVLNDEDVINNEDVDIFAEDGSYENDAKSATDEPSNIFGEEESTTVSKPFRKYKIVYMNRRKNDELTAVKTAQPYNVRCMTKGGMIKKHNETITNISGGDDSSSTTPAQKHKLTLIRHQNKCIGYKSERQEEFETDPDDMDEMPSMEWIGGEDMSTGLTREQLAKGVCPICGKTIVNKQNLICHMNIHSGRKPFICNVCRKSFAHIRNLVRHKEQQGHCDYQFTCNVKGCPRVFISSNKLNRHVKSEHQNLGNKRWPFPCKFCKKTFTSIGYLNMHVRQGHKDKQ